MRVRVALTAESTDAGASGGRYRGPTAWGTTADLTKVLAGSAQKICGQARRPMPKVFAFVDVNVSTAATSWSVTRAAATARALNARAAALR